MMPSMRNLIGWVTLVFLAVSPQALAETLYVSDHLKVTVRTGKGYDHRIIAVVESGQQVEVLKEEGQWALVRLPDDKQGWLLHRYLAREQIHAVKLAQLEVKHNNLVKQAADMLEENEQLQAANRNMEQTIAGQREDLEELRRSFTSFKSEAADYVKIKKSYERMQEQHQGQQDKLAALEAELERIQKSRMLWWFLAGAGVLLLGFMLGLSVRSKRRKSSLI
jgi:SH3 domain protein